MNRFLAIVYGAFSYVLFLVVFVYAILFVGGIAVPRSVDNAVAASAGSGRRHRSRAADAVRASSTA